jgi:hypothetical protein
VMLSYFSKVHREIKICIKRLFKVFNFEDNKNDKILVPESLSKLSPHGLVIDQYSIDIYVLGFYCAGDRNCPINVEYYQCTVRIWTVESFESPEAVPRDAI